MTEQKNPLGLKKIHHIEFYVGNVKQAEFYQKLGQDSMHNPLWDLLGDVVRSSQ